MSQLTDADLKIIVGRRDPRFDRRFLFGVKTTKIYCRPICPAQPKPENIIIFKSAAEAEGKGYRPCMRCRPDAAAGSAILAGTLNTVSRGLRIIADSSGTELDVEKLADSLGITSRHMRRLFDEHLGASPIEIMLTQRLHFAKQLIQTTKKSIVEIAYASGFGSIRRFNEAFKARYRAAPSLFRAAVRKNVHTPVGEGLFLTIPIRLPYDWDQVLSYLRRHETYGLEQVTENAYRRFVPIGKSFGTIVVSHLAAKDFLTVQFIDIPLTEIRGILSHIRSLFDTDHNPAHLPKAGVSQANGIRVPGCFDPFETAIAIILGQLVSTAHAKTVLGRLVKRFGRGMASDMPGPIFEFPSPAILSKAKFEELGITRIKSGALREFSRAVAEKQIDFKVYADFADVVSKLLAISGIGPWTAAMISMRCLGNPDAFPDRDLIIMRAIEKKLADPNDWIASRAYLTHWLWRDFAGTLSKQKRKKEG